MDSIELAGPAVRDATFDFNPAACDRIGQIRGAWAQSRPFRHVVIDDFLPAKDVRLLSDTFPPASSPVWLDWKKRLPNQYGKQGPGNSERFHLLDRRFRHALLEFNSDRFLRLLEGITSIDGLLPDPYFTGGGMHQILHGGILDIHTDFNYYARLNVYRRLNALLYLNEGWQESWGGSLELWNAAPREGGRAFRTIAPTYNRFVLFETDKSSFHGHPVEWNAPPGVYRRSIALYYYTAAPVEGKRYDRVTDFQGYVTKPLPPA